MDSPPTPWEVQDFIDDGSEKAYAKLVDRLLASPRYGERWARHWLDVVHYGDLHGADKDKPRPTASTSFNPQTAISGTPESSDLDALLAPFDG